MRLAANPRILSTVTLGGILRELPFYGYRCFLPRASAGAESKRMADNRNKSEARKRLIEMGVQPGWLPADQSAAFFDMSMSSFLAWCEGDPVAPQPHWFGSRKRWKLSELEAYGGRHSNLSHDRVMDLINASKSTKIR
jgi:hypothetical protein